MMQIIPNPIATFLLTTFFGGGGICSDIVKPQVCLLVVCRFKISRHWLGLGWEAKFYLFLLLPITSLTLILLLSLQTSKQTKTNKQKQTNKNKQTKTNHTRTNRQRQTKRQT
jgi:hypothetical protein